MMKLYSKNIFAADSPIHIGSTVFRTDEKSYEHNHDFCEFFFLEKGTLIHYLNDQTFTLDKGYIAFINSNDVHSFRKGSECQEVIMINVAFKEDLLAKAKNYLLSERINLGKRSAPVSEELLQIIKTKIEMLKEDGFNKFGSRQSILFQSLLIDVLINFSEERFGSESDIPFWLYNTLKEMQKRDNYLDGLNSFVKISGKTQEHLTRSMSKYLSTTPTAFINGLRLHEAASLLLNSDLSITDVMYESGFNNLSHFLKLFKEKFSVSPTQYRKLNRILM